MTETLYAQQYIHDSDMRIGVGVDRCEKIHRTVVSLHAKVRMALADEMVSTLRLQIEEVRRRGDQQKYEILCSRSQFDKLAKYCRSEMHELAQWSAPYFTEPPPPSWALYGVPLRVDANYKGAWPILVPRVSRDPLQNAAAFRPDPSPMRVEFEVDLARFLRQANRESRSNPPTPKAESQKPAKVPQKTLRGRFERAGKRLISWWNHRMHRDFQRPWCARCQIERDE